MIIRIKYSIFSSTATTAAAATTFIMQGVFGS
jgi:hypothetical protein